MTVPFRNTDKVESEPFDRVTFDAPAGWLGTITPYRSYGKQLLDVLLVLLMLPIALPLIAVVAVLISLDGASPFYWQTRVGRNGTKFRLLKLRTMVPDADRLLQAHLASNPEARREWIKHQKLRDDPRITRIGLMLRKTSMDELPQLWNVLCGHMSLVGPRPMMVSQKILYPGHAYYQMLPGITGLWQVSARNRSSFADRAWFDNIYHRDLSLVGDLRILVRTVGVVLRCTGN